MKCREAWKIYFKNKVAQHQYRKDNKPFSTKEIRLMHCAFNSGFEWNRWRNKKETSKNE